MEVIKLVLGKIADTHHKALKAFNVKTCIITICFKSQCLLYIQCFNTWPISDSFRKTSPFFELIVKKLDPSRKTAGSMP